MNEIKSNPRVSRESAAAPSPETLAQAQALIAEALDHFAGRRVVDAENCLHQALNQAPDHPDALHLLGLAAKQRGNDDQAIDLIEQALDLVPQNPVFLSNLANILLDAGEVEAAIDHYRRALDAEPSYADAHFNLGIALERRGQTEDAITSYRKTLELDADFVAAIHNLGSALESLGRVEEALTEYRKAVSKSPEYARAYYRIASASNAELDENELSKMEDLLPTVEPTSDSAIHLHFGLARAYNNSGRIDAAFRQWVLGNRAKRATLDYDIQNITRFHERIAETFSQEFLHERHGEGDDSDVPIFVVGMPRSGTTLVEQILASHPNVAAAGELPYLRDISRGLAAPSREKEFPENVSSLPEGEFKNLASDYIGRLRDWAPAAPHIIDKMPGNFLYVGLIKLMLPNSRIIHCVRDPMATCFSCYTHLFNSPQRFTYDLVELGIYYSSYRRLMAHWHRVAPERIFDLHYEDLVDEQEAEPRELLEFCYLDWNDSCLAFHKTNRAVRTASALQVRKPLYKSALDEWRRYQGHLSPLLEALN